MSFRSQLLLVFALVTGIAFSFAFRAVFYNKPPEPTDQELKVAQEKQIPVMVAKGNLAAGEELTAQNIRFQRFPESRIPWNAIFHFQDANGRTLVKPVQDGRLISLFDLNDPDEENTQEITFIPPGFQPTPVEIDAVRGENTDAGHLKQLLHPQDKVTLSVIEEVKSQTPDVEEGKSQRKLTTTPLFDAVEVYQVTSTRKPVDEGNEVKKVTVVSLLFNDEQLQQVQKAVKSGNLLMTIQSKENGTISLEGGLNTAASANEALVNGGAVNEISADAVSADNASIGGMSEAEVISNAQTAEPESAERTEEKPALPEGELKPVSNSSADSEMLLDSPQEKKDNSSKAADDFVFTPRSPSADLLPIRAARKADAPDDDSEN